MRRDGGREEWMTALPTGESGMPSTAALAALAASGDREAMRGRGFATKAVTKADQDMEWAMSPAEKARRDAEKIAVRQAEQAVYNSSRAINGDLSDLAGGRGRTSANASAAAAQAANDRMMARYKQQQVRQTDTRRSPHRSRKEEDADAHTPSCVSRPHTCALPSRLFVCLLGFYIRQFDGCSRSRCRGSSQDSKGIIGWTLPMVSHPLRVLPDRCCANSLRRCQTRTLTPQCSAVLFWLASVQGSRERDGHASGQGRSRTEEGNFKRLHAQRQLCASQQLNSARSPTSPALLCSWISSSSEERLFNVFRS